MSTEANVPSLDQLQNLHLPEPVSSFPSAPGWLLALMVLLITALLVAKVTHLLIVKNAYRRLAVKQLHDIYQLYGTHQSDQKLLADINQLLKSVAILRYPQSFCAKLSGVNWQDFLSRSSCHIKNLKAEVFHEFANIYTPEFSLSDARRGLMYRSAELWLKKHHDVEPVKGKSIV